MFTVQLQLMTVSDSRITFDNYTDYFIELKKKAGIAPSTANSYRSNKKSCLHGFSDNISVIYWEKFFWLSLFQCILWQKKQKIMQICIPNTLSAVIYLLCSKKYVELFRVMSFWIWPVKNLTLYLIKES